MRRLQNRKRNTSAQGSLKFRAMSNSFRRKKTQLKKVGWLVTVVLEIYASIKLCVLAKFQPFLDIN